jgi:hypothetical protein
MITPSLHDSGTAFVVFDNHRRSDMRPYVFRVSDFGRTWESLATDDLQGYALSILQDPADPELLFLGTELGLFVSTDGGEDWFRFTAGVPTTSFMDMAIQARENDLVLGTHGRSIYILDDYSALRGLTADSFKQRLAMLSHTPGQQYVAQQTPSTRFTGSGEFRADNEPYGVLLTFMASGADLPHPDEDSERRRKLSQAGGQAESKPPKVTMTVLDESGKVVRSKKFPVSQGINRINWDMKHDGVRPMPGAEPARTEDGLPPGPEVPPGAYTITLSLASGDGTPTDVKVAAEVLEDPRSKVTARARQENYDALLELQGMKETSVSAVETIVRARNDIDTTTGLIAQRQESGNGQDETLNALAEQAGELRKQLGELEQRFRVPPKTRGKTYDDDKVQNRIDLASFYVGSTRDAPSPTAQAYIEAARQSLAAAEQSLARFMSEDLAPFSQAVSRAGIGLFSNTNQAKGE